MALTLTMADREDLKPRITVFGVGGAGGNAVNNMIQKHLEGVEFVVANTDAQALAQSHAASRIQLGVRVTEGLGAGARPNVGAAAAEETIEEIVDHLAGAHMCFITAGMGGGTGTGAAPIIAQAARELGVLTVGVVTKPFQFEGAKRMRQAEEGVEALQKVVDTLIIIPNQNLFRLANEKTTFTDAFAMADDVLYQGVKGVTDLMVKPGLINLDFADVRSVMDEMGKAMMGTGEATGEDRAIQAAEKAIANPLLDEISLRGAKGVLINITGGSDLTLFELDEAANRIREEVDPDANIIVGSTLDDAMAGVMRVSVVATGIDAAVAAAEVPVARRRMAEPLSASVEQAAPPAPQPAPLPLAAAAQKAAEPAKPAEPNLFEAEREPVFVHRRDDEVPPPAYRPQAPATAARDVHVEDEAETFVAPRPRAPGTPSPEALARLQAAVNRAPVSGRAPMTAARPAPAPAPVERQSAEKPRFGINSLINRMTGHAADEPQRASPTVRQQPQIASRFEEEAEHDQEQERIEIPAFLRRQAN
jgi:cell division protein FtsZ